MNKETFITGCYIGIAVATCGWALSSCNAISTNQAKSEVYDPYKLDRITISPWVDPETGCKYLITSHTNGNHGVSVVMRLGRDGSHWCPQMDGKKAQ